MTYVLVGVAATGLALVLTPAVRALAARAGALDVPGGHRVHLRSVPTLGGIALFGSGVGAIGLAHVEGVPIAAYLASGGLDVGWLLAGAVLVVLGGIADDLRPIAPLPKLVITALAGGCAVLGHCRFEVITNPLSGMPLALGPLAIACTLLWIVVITHAVNLIDGLDGLATGVGLIAVAAILTVSIAQGRADAAALAAVLAGALLGFLVYNLHPASIFLGDSGSLLLGYLLAVLAIQGGGKGPTAIVLVVPVLALGFPLLDTALAIARRYASGGSAAIFRPDQEHIHHRLVTIGMSPHRAVLLLYAVSATFGAFAVVAYFARGPGSAAVVALAAATIYAGLRQLGYRVRTSSQVSHRA